jgi:hypothetical protein
MTIKRYPCKCGAPYKAHDWEDDGGACPLRLTRYAPDIPDRSTVEPPPPARPGVIPKSVDFSALCKNCGKPLGEHRASIETGINTARLAKPEESQCPGASTKFEPIKPTRGTFLQKAGVMSLEEYKANKPRRQKSDNRANNLTREIVANLNLAGAVMVRINTTGVWDPTRKAFRKNTTGRLGTSDILGVLPVNGRFCAIEVKIGRDKLTDDQTQFLTDVRKAGGLALEARDTFDAFLIEFCKQLTREEWQALERVLGSRFKQPKQ